MMVMRILLSNPQATKKIGAALFFVVAIFSLYFMGISSAWLTNFLTNFLPDSGEWFALNPEKGALASSFALAALLMLNWRLLQFFSRQTQIITIWLELLILVILFFVSFNLSFEFIARKIGFLITQGVVTTLYISAISIAIATLIALIGAIAKLSQNGMIYGFAVFYTSLFRGLPLLMQIYIIYLGLPQLGYVVGPIPAGIMALSLCYGAYMTEIFRAGIISIARGQSEAAAALGLNRGQTMWLVVLPQAIRLIIPPTGNQFIAMLKDSSLVSVVGVWEIMYLARTQGQAEFRHIEMLITASMIYWLLSISLELVQARIERYFGRSAIR